MKQFIYDSWNGIMNARVNPLRNIPDMAVRHMILQVLAWMWCVTFSVIVSDLMFFGTSVIAHTFLIAAICATVSAFETAKRDPNAFVFRKKYHSMGRSRGAIWIDGKKIVLPPGDPGGEHE